VRSVGGVNRFADLLTRAVATCARAPSTTTQCVSNMASHSAAHATQCLNDRYQVDKIYVRRTDSVTRSQRFCVAVCLQHAPWPWYPCSSTLVQGRAHEQARIVHACNRNVWCGRSILLLASNGMGVTEVRPLPSATLPLTPTHQLARSHPTTRLPAVTVASVRARVHLCADVRG
jgi:hypothetical protein